MFLNLIFDFDRIQIIVLNCIINILYKSTYPKAYDLLYLFNINW